MVVVDLSSVILQTFLRTTVEEMVLVTQGPSVSQKLRVGVPHVGVSRAKSAGATMEGREEQEIHRKKDTLI